MTFQDKEKKRQRGNMNLHSLLFRDLVVSAKVSIRRIKGGNNGIHTFFLIPTSAALPLVFFHYTTATLVFLFCFFFTSLSLFPLVLFLVYETCSPSSAWAFVIELLLYDTRKHIIFLLLLSFRLPNKGQ